MVRVVGLTLDRVSKRFGTRLVLDNSSVTFSPHAVNFLMGPNGVGKTTLIRCILGLEQHGGSITWNGALIDPSSRQVCAVFDDAPFHRKLSGRQNLRVLAPESLDGPVSYVSPELMKRRVHEYSHGERMRLALMAALNSGSELLILDEPMNGLDRQTMLGLKDDLCRLRATTTVLLTGHNLEFYDDIVDRAFVLQHGRVVGAGQPATDGEGGQSLAQVYERHYAPARQ